jgi:hypothetical protein
MEGPMKKVSILFILFSLLPVFSFSQTLLLEENFNYEVGVLTSLSDWDESPTGSTDIETVSGNLSYTDYPSSSTGNKIFMDGGATRSGIRRSFSTISENGNTVYASFLLEVIDLSDLDIPGNEGDYFFNFQTSTGSTSRAYIYIKQSATENKFNIGLAKSSSTSLTYTSNDLDIDSTYLIVVSYVFQSGSDEVRLWLNPDLSGAEPSPDLSLTSGADASDITYVQFRQREFSGNIYIDGVRVADTWSQAPLPVELTSITASVIDNKIELSWKTATEINNYGFEIERKTSNGSEWNKIAFVKGYGFSDSEKKYNFIDNNFSSGSYNYRLKQINFDGTFEYTNIVNVIVEVPDKFELSQNYPNPFNPNTTIFYSLPHSGLNSLKIYNALGEEVVTLINGIKEAGIHKIEFKAGHLNSGIYFYKLELGNNSQVKKMILIK